MNETAVFFFSGDRKKTQSQIDWMNNICTFTGAKKNKHTQKADEIQRKSSVFFLSA